MVNANHSVGKFGGGTRIVALLAAMTPIVAGIYQQSQQERQHNQQRHAEQQTLKDASAARLKEAADRQAALDIAADNATAESLEAALVVAQPQQTVGGRPASGSDSEFCNRLFFAATQLTNQRVADRTRAILYAALRLRRPNDEQLRVCQCSSEARIGGWLDELQQMIPPTSGSARDRLSSAVRTAVAECVPDPGVIAQATPMATLQAQLKVTVAERDELQQTLSRMSRPVGSSGLSAGIEPPPAGSAPTSVPPPPSSPIASAPSPTAPAPAAPCQIDSPDDKTSRIRVFIQVPDAAAKTAAEALRIALNAQPPFKSPGIEIVGRPRSPQALEIRYTYPADRAAAQLIAKAIGAAADACGAAGGNVRLAWLQANQGRTDTGVIEVWWPRPSTIAQMTPATKDSK